MTLDVSTITSSIQLQIKEIRIEYHVLLRTK